MMQGVCATMLLTKVESILHLPPGALRAATRKAGKGLHRQWQTLKNLSFDRPPGTFISPAVYKPSREGELDHLHLI